MTNEERETDKKRNKYLNNWIVSQTLQISFSLEICPLEH